MNIIPCEWVRKEPIYNSRIKRWLSKWFNIKPDRYEEVVYLVGGTVYVSFDTYEKLKES